MTYTIRAANLSEPINQRAFVHTYQCDSLHSALVLMQVLDKSGFMVYLITNS